ncbi:sigma-70 family RNA polymerase sigma factor, partial [bacterium]|nr:sigma-70 family RNA polymerase sigma factor [bacterium]
MEPDPEEVDWIRRTREGDADAFAELVRRYQRLIHALTYRMTGSPADAEDLAQEIFLQAYRRLDRFRGDAKFSSWLYRIGVNTCLNWRKSRQRRQQLHDDWAAEHAAPDDHSNDLGARVQ